jgi:hypothetical protein
MIIWALFQATSFPLCALNPVKGNILFSIHPILHSMFLSLRIHVHLQLHLVWSNVNSSLTDIPRRKAFGLSAPWRMTMRPLERCVPVRVIPYWGSGRAWPHDGIDYVGTLEASGTGSGHIGQGHIVQGTHHLRDGTSTNFRSGTHRRDNCIHLPVLLFLSLCI